jgi:hypothetical protein
VLALIPMGDWCESVPQPHASFKASHRLASNQEAPTSAESFIYDSDPCPTFYNDCQS